MSCPTPVRANATLSETPPYGGPRSVPCILHSAAGGSVVDASGDVSLSESLEPPAGLPRTASITSRDGKRSLPVEGFSRRRGSLPTGRGGAPGDPVADIEEGGGEVAVALKAVPLSTRRCAPQCPLLFIALEPDGGWSKRHDGMWTD